MTRPKINTMKELSEAIGVSRPTLSRYFQDSSAVRPSTAQKIERLLVDVDYVPNFFATRMNRKTSGLIGVIIPHLSDLFFTSLIEEIEVQARAAGFTIFIQSSNGDPNLEAQAIEKQRSMSVDGMIVVPLGMNGSLDKLQTVSSELPVVYVDSRPADDLFDIDFVGTDNHQGIGIIVDYLCRTGPPPVFLGMPRLNSNARERERAYANHMQRLGHEPHIIDGSGASESWRFETLGHGVMDAEFGRNHYIAATILCANDRLAIGAIRAANQHGLLTRLGEKSGGLRVAGHDDHPLSRYMSPSLTTVAQDVEGIGKAAVELLVERIGGAEKQRPKQLLYETVLKVRDSA